ncbi:MAG: TipAS antibiotic-recognition domain-containing protein [Parafannyhessea sp.]|uniref:TipAS antibiotic-recognition domain-containing protein n=1 Tax=Parafannyhessea sp. TaxID=2847324 RepID=UPI003F106DC5
MADSGKFEALKRDLVEKNERAYGAEVRDRWGDAAADAANARLMGLSREEFERARRLEAEVRAEVLAGLADGDPDGSHGAAAARAHAGWLQLFWPKGTYTPEAHALLAQSYLADERFRAYYEAWAPGAAEFLIRAIEALAQESAS